jgi:hypothetical protein
MFRVPALVFVAMGSARVQPFVHVGANLTLGNAIRRNDAPSPWEESDIVSASIPAPNGTTTRDVVHPDDDDVRIGPTTLEYEIVPSPMQYSRFATAFRSAAPDRTYRRKVKRTGRALVSRKSRSGRQRGIENGIPPPSVDDEDKDDGSSTHSVRDKQTSATSPIPVVVDDVPIASAILPFVEDPLFADR